MPGDKGHTTITLITAGASVPTAFYRGVEPVNVAILAASVLWSGYFFSPDLDLASAPLRRWRYLRWIWYFYERLLPHRSILSHGILIGTLGRLLYFAVMASLAVILGATVATVGIDLLQQQPVDLTAGLGIWDWLAGEVWEIMEAHQRESLAVLIGLEIGSVAHIVPDYVTTFIKRRVAGATHHR